MPIHRTLGLFAKEPRPGQVKTRLAAATSPAWAAAVADAFLRDFADRLAGLDCRRCLVYVGAPAYFAEVAAGRYDLVPQQAGDLGQRLSSFMADELAAGTEAVVVVGADSPTMPPGLAEQAFAELERADVVLGPATDGGYYLLGCHRLPPVFGGIAWGTSRVLAETVARLDPSWRLALLPPWYDVDTLDDWRMLCGHLAALRRAGIDPGLPRTEALDSPPLA